MTTIHTRQLQQYTQDILKYNMYKRLTTTLVVQQISLVLRWRKILLSALQIIEAHALAS